MTPDTRPPVLVDLPAPRLRIGIDLVEVAAIERSLADFGASFTHRLFAPQELRDALMHGHPDVVALAVRFAAKEALIKAFDLCEAGVGWAQIDLREIARGQARVVWTGAAARAVAAHGTYETAVSWSQVGALACAIVVALPVPPRRPGYEE